MLNSPGTTFAVRYKERVKIEAAIIGGEAAGAAAALTVPADARAETGDLVRPGISHPRATFDKWRKMPLVEDQYSILDIYETHF